MLQWIYRGDYDLNPPTGTPYIEIKAEEDEDTPSDTSAPPLPTSPNSSIDDEHFSADPFLTHIHIYALAERYSLPPLRTLALEKFTAACDTATATTTTTTVPIIPTHHLIRIASTIYRQTSPHAVGLRAELLDLAYHHHAAAFDSHAFLDAVEERPDLREFGRDFVSMHAVRQARLVQERDVARRWAAQLGARLAESAVREDGAREALRRVEERSRARGRTAEEDLRRAGVELATYRRAVAVLEGLASIGFCARCNRLFSYHLTVSESGAYQASCRSCGHRLDDGA
jgi:hypothetical protein